MENAIFNRVDFSDSYIYSPPAWRVCGCENGKYTKRIKSGAGSALDGAEYDLTIPCRECADSPIKGRIPIYYTPEQWEEAGGVLSDDTPVWVRYNDEEHYCWDLIEYSSALITDTVVIATEAGRPPKGYVP
jgi:hypothetical protein